MNHPHTTGFRAFRVLPSSDIHLVKAPAPDEEGGGGPEADFHLDRITLQVWRYSRTVPPEIVTVPPEYFELEGTLDPDAGENMLRNAVVEVDTTTGEITAIDVGRTYLKLRVDLEHVDGAHIPYFDVVHIEVYADLPIVWLGNTTGSVNEGEDNFVVSVFAQTTDGEVADITGHGFVELSSPGNEVDPVSGRVDARASKAGDVIEVSVTRDGEPVSGSPLSVTVKPALDAPRAILEPVGRPGTHPDARNILFLAEGFTRGQEPLFRRLVRRIERRLRKRRVHEPFRMLRDDYKCWMAFEESPTPGITIAARLNNSGKFGGIGHDAYRRPTQAKDSAFGLSYGHRHGDLLFSPDANLPMDEHWFERNVPRSVVLRDWRRQASDQGRWDSDKLTWLSSLQTRDGQPIGASWAHVGADRGLVVVLVNDELGGGLTETGNGESVDGYIFCSVSLGINDHFSLVNELGDGDVDFGPRRDHLVDDESYLETVGDTKLVKARLRPALTAIHELAHALFLGDEYEAKSGTVENPNLTWNQRYDNLEVESWMLSHHGEAGRPEPKWGRLDRVSRGSATRAWASVETSGTIVVDLFAGEGAKWSQGDSVALRTRNINHASTETFEPGDARDKPLHSLYPRYRDHAPVTVRDLEVVAVDGDEVTLSGDGLEAGMVFFERSLLFQPLPDLKLVLPGVLDYMARWVEAKKQWEIAPLHGKGGNCDDADTSRRVVTSVPAATLGVRMPAKKERLIGLYEGGGQSNCKVFRPTGRCVMRDEHEINVDDDADATHRVGAIGFCHVCKYTIVNEINPSRHADLDLDYPGRPL